MWTVVVGAAGGVAQSTINKIVTLTEAVADYWGWYIDDSLANITIELNFEALEDTTLATGATDYYFRHSQGGLDYFEPTTIIELTTGTDSNGVDPDIVITIDTGELNAGEFYFGPVVGGVSSGAPGNQFDLFTILVHEVGHGLGMISFLDEGGTDRSTWDQLVLQSGGQVFFTGPQAVAFYGGDVPLDVEFSHLHDSLGSALGPTVGRGGVNLLGPLEIFIFSDLDAPIRAPSAGRDTLHGFFGLDDAINGLAGDDTIDGLSGLDLLDGDSGDDTLIGGAGDDRLIGGDGDDVLDGGDHLDQLNGDAGDDMLIGGLGADLLDGGADKDTADYSDASGGVLVRLFTGAAERDIAEGDALVSIENLVGSDFNDALFGSNSVDNRLEGGAGGDYLNGLSGDDTLIGGSGGDNILGGTGDDFFDGGAGADNLEGDAGADTASYADATAGIRIRLFRGTGEQDIAEGDTLVAIENLVGSRFHDILFGSNSVDNRLEGAAGNDYLNALSGDDALSGGSGDDNLLGGTGDDLLEGGAGADNLEGEAGLDSASYSDATAGVLIRLFSGAGERDIAEGDTLVLIENLVGSNFNDTLFGSNGLDNRLEGGARSDYLNGLSGNDTLIGGDGSDNLIGGAGNDTFIFTIGDGADRVQDFAAGLGLGDLLHLSGYDANFDSFAEVIAAARQVGDDTIIDLGGGDSIALIGVALASLDEDDFTFG